MHVIDTATMEPGRDPLSDLDVIERELASYGGLEDRPRLVALNKVDVPDGRDLADIVLEDFEARGLQVFPCRAASHEGLRELSFAMAELVARSRAERPAAEATAHRAAARRRPAGGPGLHRSAQTGEGWRVRGDKPERWVRQTDFSNDEAVGFLADRLNRLGVEDRAARARRAEGDAVLIGDADNAVVFDFRPMVDDRRRAARPPRARTPRFEEPVRRPQRRRDIDAAMATAREGETRADVARRLGTPTRRRGPMPTGDRGRATATGTPDDDAVSDAPRRAGRPAAAPGRGQGRARRR